MCRPDRVRASAYSQNFQLLAPDISQRICLRHADGRPTWSTKDLMFQNEKSWDAWILLARPDPRQHMKQAISFEAQGAPLLTMPTEILLMITDQLSAIDLFALAFASKELFASVTPLIERQVMESAAPWAGCRFACLGTHVRDLPPSFMEGEIAYRSVGLSVGPSERHKALRTYWDAYYRYRPAGKLGMHVYTAAFETCKSADWCPRSKIGEVDRLISGHDLFPGDREWVLRNLDSIEYVRCQPGTDLRGYVRDDLQENRITIEDILLQRMGWTECSLPSHLRVISDSLFEIKGPWAGHRFDVVSMRAHCTELAGQAQDWTDITLEVVRDTLCLKGML